MIMVDYATAKERLEVPLRFKLIRYANALISLFGIIWFVQSVIA